MKTNSVHPLCRIALGIIIGILINFNIQAQVTLTWNGGATGTDGQSDTGWNNTGNWISSNTASASTPTGASSSLSVSAYFTPGTGAYAAPTYAVPIDSNTVLSALYFNPTSTTNPTSLTLTGSNTLTFLGYASTGTSTVISTKANSTITFNNPVIFNSVNNTIADVVSGTSSTTAPSTINFNGAITVTNGTLLKLQNGIINLNGTLNATSTTRTTSITLANGGTVINWNLTAAPTGSFSINLGSGGTTPTSFVTLNIANTSTFLSASTATISQGAGSSNSGSKVFLTGNKQTLANAFTTSDANTSTNGSSLYVIGVNVTGGGIGTFSGNLTTGTANASTRALYANSGSTAIFTGKISGGSTVVTYTSNSSILLIDGGGSVILNGSTANTFYASRVEVTNSTALYLANTSGAAISASAASLVIDNGASVTLSGSNQITTSTGLTLNGGTFSLNGYNGSLGALTLSASSTLVLGTTGNSISFLDSSSSTWTGTLNITGLALSTNSTLIRFGTSDLGLTSSQLSDISYNGSSTGFTIDSNGWLVATVPEPSTLCLMVAATLILFFLPKRRFLRMACSKI
jgi:hypothetical protein